MITDDHRRDVLRAADAEEFDTGANSQPLLAVFVSEPSEARVGNQVVMRRSTLLRCLTTDAETHKLIKGSPITRRADGTKYFVLHLERGHGGFTTIRLRA
jgi:hypothetical protein